MIVVAPDGCAHFVFGEAVVSDLSIITIISMREIEELVALF